mmetsp:Transcript_54477/g.143904  ORF Transcript_54477/g.143904 Transcript_54477/m.143904 type:complete len:210 (+) Transcript_54477:1948-2577(+)
MSPSPGLGIRCLSSAMSRRSLGVPIGERSSGMPKLARCVSAFQTELLQSVCSQSAQRTGLRPTRPRSSILPTVIHPMIENCTEASSIGGSGPRVGWFRPQARGPAKLPETQGIPTTLQVEENAHRLPIILPGSVMVTLNVNNIESQSGATSRRFKTSPQESVLAKCRIKWTEMAYTRTPRPTNQARQKEPDRLTQHVLIKRCLKFSTRG